MSHAIQLPPSYHLVLPEHSRYTYSSTTSEFDSHLALICSAASRPADCSLTFDDAHVSQFRFAFPLLQQYRLRACFFAIAGWIGRRPDYMHWHQLRQLVSSGHQVQSHSFSHVALTRCSDAELRSELANSRSELEQRLGAAVNAISIPFGRWDLRVIDACARAGYSQVFTSDPSAPRRVGGVAVLGRFMVRRTTTLDQLKKVLSADGHTLRWLRARHQCKLLLRASIGERAYDGLWGILRSRKSLSAASRMCESQVDPQ